MAVPKKRKSYSRTRLKLSSPRHKLFTTNLIKCNRCSMIVRPHQLNDHGKDCRPKNVINN